MGPLAGQPDAGVVDPVIEPTERVDGEPDRVLDRVARGNVGVHELSDAASAADGVDGPRAAMLVEIRDDDLGALPGEVRCDCLADP